MKKHLTKASLKELSKYERVNLVNSITGYKSANLIGTQDAKGQTNLAIFNSVTHLGSDPAMITLTLRPNTVERHSYNNMLATGFFTVNHVSVSISKQSHQTAARYPKEVSEFKATGLNTEYLNDFTAPYVQESVIKLGCKYVNSYEIKENGCLIVVATIEDFHFNDDFLEEDYWLRLDKAETVTINGLDGYALPQLIDRFAYPKPDKEVSSVL